MFLLSLRLAVNFDLSTAQGKMITGVLSVLSQFERDLISERTKSGLQAAVARGKNWAGNLDKIQVINMLITY